MRTKLTRQWSEPVTSAWISAAKIRSFKPGGYHEEIHPPADIARTGGQGKEKFRFQEPGL